MFEFSTVVCWFIGVSVISLIILCLISDSIRIRLCVDMLARALARHEARLVYKSEYVISRQEVIEYLSRRASILEGIRTENHEERKEPE